MEHALTRDTNFEEDSAAMKEDINKQNIFTPSAEEEQIVITYNQETDELTWRGPTSYNKKQEVQLKQLIRQGLITLETEKYSQKKQRKCPHSKGKRGAAELSQLVLHRVSPTVETMKELLPDMMDAVYYQDEARLKIAGKWQTIPRGWPGDIRLVPPGNYIFEGDGQKRKTRLADLKPMYDFLRKELLKKQNVLNIANQNGTLNIDNKSNISSRIFKYETDAIDNAANNITDVLNRKRRIDVDSVTSSEPEEKFARLASDTISPDSQNRPYVNIIPKTINKFEEGKEISDSMDKLCGPSHITMTSQKQYTPSSFLPVKRRLSEGEIALSSYHNSLPKTVRMLDDVSDKSEILRRTRKPPYRSSPGCNSPVYGSNKDRPASTHGNLPIMSSRINNSHMQSDVMDNVHNQIRNQDVIDSCKDLAKESNTFNGKSHVYNGNNEINNIKLAQPTTIVCSGKSANSINNDTIPTDNSSIIMIPEREPCQNVNEDKNRSFTNELPPTSTYDKSTLLQISNGMKEASSDLHDGVSNTQHTDISQPTVDIRSTQVDSPTNSCQNSINITIPATIRWTPDGGDTGTLTGAAMIDMPLGVAQLQGLINNISNQKSPSLTQSPISTPELTQTKPVVFSMTSPNVTQVSRCSPLTTEGNGQEEHALLSEHIVNKTVHQTVITKTSNQVISMDHMPDVMNCDSRVETNCNSPRQVTGTALCENFVTSTSGEASSRSDMGSPSPCSSISNHTQATSTPNVSDAELLLAFSQGDNGCKFADTLETKSHKEEEGWRNVWKKKRGCVVSAGPHQIAMPTAAPPCGSNGTHTIPVGMAQAAALCVRPPKSTADVKPASLSR